MAVSGAGEVDAPPAAGLKQRRHIVSVARSEPRRSKAPPRPGHRRRRRGRARCRGGSRGCCERFVLPAGHPPPQARAPLASSPDSSAQATTASAPAPSSRSHRPACPARRAAASRRRRGAGHPAEGAVSPSSAAQRSPVGAAGTAATMRGAGLPARSALSTAAGRTTVVGHQRAPRARMTPQVGSTTTPPETTKARRMQGFRRMGAAGFEPATSRV